MKSRLGTFLQKKNEEPQIKEQQLPGDETWKNDLISLYCIRNHDGLCLFAHHFQVARIAQLHEPQLIGMGFTAITRMLCEVVDSKGHLRYIDFITKKVLVEENQHQQFLTVLITTRDTPIVRKKLRKFTECFAQIFQLQHQINLRKNYISKEDYALASEFVAIIFSNKSNRVLNLFPLIFDSIRTEQPIGGEETKIVTSSNTTPVNIKKNI
ncbi:MAG: hypothetical protein ACFFE8_00500 [Candidatus Heimdallarchaeota archaeon]